MAQIPDWTALPSAVPQPSDRRVPVDDSGQVVAAATENFAGAIKHLGEVLYQRQKADAVTAASNQLSDFRIQNQAALDQAKQKADPDTLGDFAPGVLQDFDQRAGKLLEGVSPLAHNFVQQGLTSERERLGTHATEWADQQRTAYNAQSVLDNLDKLSPAVAADPSQKADIGGQLLAQINLSGVAPAQQAELRRRVMDELTMAGTRGMASQDPLGTYNRLNDPNDSSFSGLNVTQRASLQQYARAQLVDQQATALEQTYAQNGAKAGTEALVALGNNSAFPGDLRDEIRQKTNGLLGQLREERRNQYVDQITQLEEHIATGQAGAADRANAWALYHNNAFDPAQLSASLGAINRSEIKQAQSSVALAAVADAYTNSHPLDPKDQDVKDATGTLFAALTKAAQPGSPEYANRAVDMATRTGVVPEPAISWARAHLTAGDPASAAQSADLVARLEESNPRALGFGIDEKTKAIADTISQAVRAGTPAPVAVEMARNNATLSKADTLELAEKWKVAKADSTQLGALTNLLKADPHFAPGFFSSLPAIPTSMQGDFDQATQRYFDLTGGNLTQARQLAARDVSRVWGVSEVNGKREILPYAPEAMFPGLSPLVVRQDIEKTVSEHPQAFQRLDPATGKLVSATPAAASIRLIPTDRTARTNGVEWNLGAPDPFGAMDVLRGADGNPLVYRLPVSATDFDAVRERMAQAAIAKARQMQADAQAAAELAKEAEGQFVPAL